MQTTTISYPMVRQELYNLFFLLAVLICKSMPPNTIQVFILFLPLGKYPKFRTELVHHPPLLHACNDFLQLKFEQIQDIKKTYVSHPIQVRKS